MQKELTNLISPTKERDFRRNYFMRVAVVSVLLLALVVIIHGVLLLPTYFYLNDELKGKATELATVSAQQTTQEQQAQLLETQLQTQSQNLITLGAAPTASSVLQEVLAAPRSGIMLTGFNYSPPTPGAPGTLLVSGVASTRESLRNYDQTLSVLPSITSANLPISDYAADRNISFTITVMGSFSTSHS